ncbi:hypothetical protein A4X13_0g5287 [Tilletia indica]|uniref:Uncharacterized protein n=1 Tax=Tilletia indica TaxID=43049 RepID=A0A177TR12_9BASI|nr:hypothetical protein A4X13_0g5287 [Tilletia indica]
MGRSAKGYKKPTLKEKQQSRKAKSSSHDGAIVKDWSAPSSTVRLAAAAMKQSAGSSSKPKGKLAADEDEEADDILDEAEEDDVDSASKSAEATSSEATGNQTKKKRDLRSRSKGATGSGGTDGEEARTPREQGIDYLQLWQGRKTEIASARIKQGRPVQK